MTAWRACFDAPSTTSATELVEVERLILLATRLAEMEVACWDDSVSRMAGAGCVPAQSDLNKTIET